MAYAPPAAADVGAQLEANGARPSVAAGAFVVPTSVEINLSRTSRRWRGEAP
jgi:hypothetical protein